MQFFLGYSVYRPLHCVVVVMRPTDPASIWAVKCDIRSITLCFSSPDADLLFLCCAFFHWTSNYIHLTIISIPFIGPNFTARVHSPNLIFFAQPSRPSLLLISTETKRPRFSTPHTFEPPSKRLVGIRIKGSVRPWLACILPKFGAVGPRWGVVLGKLNHQQLLAHCLETGYADALG